MCIRRKKFLLKIYASVGILLQIMFKLFIMLKNLRRINIDSEIR